MNPSEPRAEQGAVPDPGTLVSYPAGAMAASPEAPEITPEAASPRLWPRLVRWDEEGEDPADLVDVDAPILASPCYCRGPAPILRILGVTHG